MVRALLNFFHTALLIGWPRCRAMGGTMVALSLATASLAHVQAVAADAPAVTRYRPNAATPAALSTPAWVELEAGGPHSRSSVSALCDSLPFTLKLAFTEDWGKRFGGEAWVRQTDEAREGLCWVGNSSIVLKRRFAINETSAFGLEAGTALTTGMTGIGSEKSDRSINAIASADLGEHHTDINLPGARVGAVEPGVSRTQALWAASLSKSLNDQWGIVGEFSGTRQKGARSTRQFLCEAICNASKSLSWDVGFVRSLRSAVPDWSAFTGHTMLVQRLS